MHPSKEDTVTVDKNLLVEEREEATAKMIIAIIHQQIGLKTQRLLPILLWPYL